jgi:hypothetical protein
MVTIYKKKGNTIRIKLPNLDLMLFKASEEDCEVLQENNSGYVEINLVGRCALNEFNGIKTPQILIEEYEVVDSNKYFF